MGRPTVRRAVIGTVWLVAVVGLAAVGCGPSRSQGLGDGERYATWREALTQARFVAASLPGYDPIPGHYVEPRDGELAAALARLRPLFDGLVLYATSQFELRLLEEARHQGFRAVVLGIWNPRDPEELQRAAGAAIRWPDMCWAICVGNEGLLGNEYQPEDLEVAATFLHETCPGVPLTTSEPIGSYGDALLAGYGDSLLAPNIHPWFSMQREPEAAVGWVRERVQALRETVGPEPLIFVKETGLPSGGDDGASLERQAGFWATLLEHGPLAPDVAVSCFEAYDLSWKARESGLAIEGHWGLWAEDGQPKPAARALADLWQIELLEPVQ